MAPLGMEMEVIYLQTTAVSRAINGFLVSLAEAVAIVVLVLLVFMGLRSGLIIGGVLLVTILGTFIFMDIWHITLERVSLGALIIALGMLVDNAIVVTDGMRMKMKRGMDALKAAREVVGRVAVPLLAATLIAVAAFAAIGTSPDSTGEYCRTLFFVILISLMLSWATAVTTTPLLCRALLKTEGGKKDGNGARKDPYGGGLYRIYKGFLSWAIRLRWITLAGVVGLFVLAVAGFGHVKNSFFVDSTSPMYYINFWFPEGTHIEETTRQMKKAEDYLAGLEHVDHVITMIGGGQVRFLLTYAPESVYGGFAQVIVTVADYKNIPELFRKSQNDLERMFPQATVNARLFVLGPATGGKIQLRISGPDPEVLRRLGAKAEAVVLADPLAKGVRNEWRNRVKVVRPLLAEAQARRAGIDRPQVARAVQAAMEGTRAGVYRERDELIPIIARSPEDERTDLDNLETIQIWSPAAGKMIPIGQVVSGFGVAFEDPYIWRRDRTKMLRLHFDQRQGLPIDLLKRVKPKIEQALGVDIERKLGKTVSPEEWTADTIPIKYRDTVPLKGMPGYHIAWGGDFEDSNRAQTSLGNSVPIFFGLMILLVILLFNSIKKTLIIWLTVPLSLIGVTAGLLMFGQPFGFMSLLGLMSLSGMLIKNAIVLIDQIDLELTQGKAPFRAVLDSGVNRLIPVSMAALTTILGMIPLLQDAFFIAMAVTIMFGLGFATVLTLVVVPVLYSVFYRVTYVKGEA